MQVVAKCYVCRLLQNRPWGLHPQTPVKSTDAANQNLHLPHPLILQLPTNGVCNLLYFTLAINTVKTAGCIPLHSLPNISQMPSIRNTMTSLKQMNLLISYMTACPRQTHWSQPSALLLFFAASVKNDMYIVREYSFRIKNTGVPRLLHLSKQCNPDSNLSIRFLF